LNAPIIKEKESEETFDIDTFSEYVKNEDSIDLHNGKLPGVKMHLKDNEETEIDLIFYPDQTKETLEAFMGSFTLVTYKISTPLDKLMKGFTGRECDHGAKLEGRLQDYNTNQPCYPYNIPFSSHLELESQSKKITFSGAYVLINQKTHRSTAGVN